MGGAWAFLVLSSLPLPPSPGILVVPVPFFLADPPQWIRHLSADSASSVKASRNEASIAKANRVRLESSIEGAKYERQDGSGADGGDGGDEEEEPFESNVADGTRDE
jgi:hypothetical protein